MRSVRTNLFHRRSGQSLIETALLLPIMLTIVFNAVNIGYFFFVALNLAAAPRQGSEYSIQGTASFQQSQLPSASSVESMVNDDITGAIPSAANTPHASVQPVVGIEPHRKRDRDPDTQLCDVRKCRQFFGSRPGPGSTVPGAQSCGNSIHGDTAHTWDGF